MINIIKNKLPSFGLTTTFAISFFALSVVVLLISGTIQIYSYYRTQQESISSKQHIIAQDASLNVSHFIQDKFNVLETTVNLTKPSTSSKKKQK